MLWRSWRFVPTKTGRLSIDLLVAQRVNRILTRGAQRGIERADRATDQSNHERDRDPLRLDIDNERSRAHYRCAQEQRQHYSDKDAEHAHENSFLFDNPRN